MGHVLEIGEGKAILSRIGIAGRCEVGGIGVLENVAYFIACVVIADISALVGWSSAGAS